MQEYGSGAGRDGTGGSSLDRDGGFAAVLGRPPVDFSLHPGILRGLRILIVDDDPDIRAAVECALEASGAEVVAAGSADEALDALEWLRPSVLVSDLGMPRRDGWSLIREVRARPSERGGDVPAIALTAFTGRSARERALAAGFQLHAVKPIETAALIALIAHLGRYHRAHAIGAAG